MCSCLAIHSSLINRVWLQIWQILDWFHCFNIDSSHSLQWLFSLICDWSWRTLRPWSYKLCVSFLPSRAWQTIIQIWFSISLCRSCVCNIDHDLRNRFDYERQFLGHFFFFEGFFKGKTVTFSFSPTLAFFFIIYFDFFFLFLWYVYNHCKTPPLITFSVFLYAFFHDMGTFFSFRHLSTSLFFYVPIYKVHLTFFMKRTLLLLSVSG